MPLASAGHRVKLAASTSNPMKKIHLLPLTTLFAGLVAFAPVAARAQEPEKLSLPTAITGGMDIEFRTRKNLDDKGKPQKGVTDQYVLSLNVAQTTEFKGSIQRQPAIGGILGTGQKAQLAYSIDLAVLNPANLSQKRSVGKWVGTVPVTGNGEYNEEGLPDSLQRIAVDAIGKAPAFTDKFGGKLIGKGKKAANAVTYIRQLAGKEVKVEVKNTDPMRFESLALAMGPAQTYPRTVVNGNLDYDYETGNYYTNGIRFLYQQNGKETEDVVTGSIKWVEDANRASNGKGQYEFNLRFNEAKNTKPAGEAAAFAKMSDEEAFFAVDNTIPSLTGTITYEDQMTTVGDKQQPGSSKIKYNLAANQLTKVQIMNFFKLWLVCVGPTNDE